MGQGHEAQAAVAAVGTASNDPVALAAWSGVDFVRYRRTKDTKTLALGLPNAVQQRIHKVIRVGLSTRGLLAGSVTVGAAVALLESLCAGQVYLPTIVFVMQSPSLRASAVGHLLLYNVMFIVPLAADPGRRLIMLKTVASCHRWPQRVR